MEIRIEFDEQELVRFVDGKGPLLFEVSWENNGIYYPMKHWSDFGNVILGWWFVTTVELLKGANEGDFSFMDGPYSLKAKYNRQTGIVELLPEKRDFVWNIPIIDLVKKLIQALDKTCEELAKRGIGQKEQASLTQCSTILKNYL
jgi:hypothetical protein